MSFDEWFFDKYHRTFEDMYMQPYSDPKSVLHALSVYLRAYVSDMVDVRKP